MDMPKLLIADSSKEMRQILFDNLHNSYQIAICADGADAITTIRSFQPDLLILDLMLPGLDGITLLHRMQSEGFHPAVLTTCYFYSEYVVNALHKLGVDYMMRKPCQWQAIADRLSDLSVATQPATYPPGDMSNAVSSLLLELGLAPRNDGFRFLQAAIPLYMQDPGMGITKELYVTIGEMYNKSSTQVERSMRSAIESAWKSADNSLWHRYFAVPGDHIPKPSNSDFISRLALALSKQGYRSA